MRYFFAVCLMLLAWSETLSQDGELLLFPECNLRLLEMDSVRSATQIRIYDTCWVSGLKSLSEMRLLNATEIGIVGEFPPVNLNQLETLIVQNNSISVLLCGRLQNVSKLDLSGNPIDEEGFDNIVNGMPHLRSIRLGGSLIKRMTLPSKGTLRSLDMCYQSELQSVVDVPKHTRLNFLGLSACALDGNELELSQSKIDSIDLSFNELEWVTLAGLPASIRYIDLSNNPLRGWSGDLSRFRKLRTIEMHDCEFGGLPADLSMHEGIRKLVIEWDNLIDSENISERINLPPKLETLNIEFTSMNPIDRLPVFNHSVHLSEISFLANTPRDLSTLNDFVRLRVIRFINCSIKAIEEALSTLKVEGNFDIWVDDGIDQLSSRFPWMRFHAIEMASPAR